MESQLSQTKIRLIKYLRELEENKRNEKKKFLYETGYKVYRQGIQRMSSKLVDVWEDGEDIVNFKKRMLEIQQDKNNLEKEWNKVTSLKKNQIKENNDNNKVIDKYEEEDKLKLINYRMIRLTNVFNILFRKKMKLRINLINLKKKRYNINCNISALVMKH